MHRPEREGLVNLAAFVSQDTHRAFKMLAAEEGITNTTLMNEAVAHILTRHGKPVPREAITHLKEHHRPLPQGTKIAKPKGSQPS